ncbi:putative aminoadipate reductase [Mycena metata]|uniref:Aminoadipate reductase n=1 Tax=Mycena metata TaxID=1033252 RepID=A0AAD7MXP6_9AGAR|nr:putative aminoadipate reductase [Mycena metata]
MAFQRPLASPPLDGSILLHEIPDFNLIHNPEHVFYTWKDAHTEEIHGLTHLEFGRAVHRAAAAVKHLVRGQPVGVLALCDTVLYHALFLGLMKAGHVPYLLSPRNSSAATAKLLTDVGCHQILATPFTLAPLLKEVRELLEQSSYAISIEEIPTTESVFPYLGRETAPDPFVECDTVIDDVQLSSVAFYLHSSGSTGLPKTIPQTQQSIIHWCTLQCITDLRLHRPGLRIGATILPSFHTLGIYFQLLTPLVALCVVNVAPPICPPKTSLPFVASPANALDHARATACNSVVTIPAILEMWALNPDSVAFLRTFHVVWFSGGTLSEVVGDALARSGVTVNSVYGATELGAPVHTVPFAKDIADGDWVYLRFDSRVDIQWVPYGDDLFEAVFLSTEKHKPAVFNLPNERGYATGDLFKRHPSKDLWKVTDDVIVLSSGEKAVPGPAEDIICSSPAVSICMMFGRERHQVGLIVQPSQPLDSSDEVAILAFQRSIHPVIEQANHFNPAFARILPEKVFITEASKPLIRNAKGALHRKVCLAAFEREISAMYDDTNNPPASEDLPSLRAGFTESELSEWLRQQIRVLSDKNIRSEGDFFEQGLDSITISSLRHRVITLDWIYQHPSIDAMVASLCSSDIGSNPTSIQSIIDKYSHILRPRVARTDTAPPHSGVVVLTGSTGALGSQILSLLVARADVTVIYCLNRDVAGENLFERQKRAFRKIGLNENQLESPKVQLLLADLNAPDLGLPAAIVTELERSSFSAIHTAWRLDFNLTLTSFESHILATVNLINFASSHSGFRGFYFTSSIGAVQGWASHDPVPEIVMPEANLARGQGYGEGKYVIERLLEIANVNSVSFRIGQISGGPPLGAWPVTEWFPILVKSSIAMKLLPVFGGVTSWVPSDAVAHTILDAVFAAPGGSHSVVNVAHPHPVPWSNIAAWIVEALEDPQIRPVDAKEWVNSLRQESTVHLRESNVDAIPALKLLPFFEALTAAQKRTEVGGLPTLAVSNARLLNLPRLDHEDARRWVKYWRASGFL